MASPQTDQMDPAITFLRASIQARMDDWLGSTSEAYAAPPVGLVPPEAWVNGLISYLIDGPGALRTVMNMLIKKAEDRIRERVEAVLPDCRVMGANAEGVVPSCLDLVGAIEVSKGFVWTLDMCCDPCQVRAALTNRPVNDQ